MALEAKTYRINLIRALREKEYKAERQKRLGVLLFTGCFGMLILTFLYSAMTIWQMENVLKSEERKLVHLKNEYKKYTGARLIVDKSDVELLTNLQGSGIFWTKKLAAMAKHLPEGYAINRFSYSGGELRVSGWGFVNVRQDQLLVLDEYMKHLRNDTTFSSVFGKVFLSRADRINEGGTNRVAFEFVAINEVKGVRR